MLPVELQFHRAMIRGKQGLNRRHRLDFFHVALSSGLARNPGPAWPVGSLTACGPQSSGVCSRLFKRRALPRDGLELAKKSSLVAELPPKPVNTNKKRDSRDQRDHEI